MFSFVLTSPILAIIVVLLVAFFYALVIGSHRTALIRQICLVASFIALFVGILAALSFDKAAVGYQYMSNFSLTAEYNSAFALGVDGLSYVFLVLTLFTFPFLFLAAWNVSKFPKHFFCHLLAMEILLVLTFVTIDLFYFFVLFESLLIPMFLLIGSWGARTRKIKAAYYFFLYTLFGSLFMLFGMIYLYQTAGSLNYYVLLSEVIESKEQRLLWVCLFLAFAVKMPLFPFHIWLPEAHVEAPTVGSMLLASLLLKLGGYGILRFLLTFLTDASVFFTPLVVTLGIAGVVYGSLSTLRQIDLKRVIAYSSVAHMNLVVVGLFSFTRFGIEGAIYMMVAHGVVSSALFFLVGVIYDRTHTRLLRYYGGLVTVMPLFVSFFFVFSLANMGFPGTPNFPGELLILMGAFAIAPHVAFESGLGVVFSSAYSTFTHARISFGTLKTKYVQHFIDMLPREVSVVFVLLVAATILGIQTAPVLTFVEVSSWDIAYFQVGSLPWLFSQPSGSPSIARKIDKATFFSCAKVSKVSPSCKAATLKTTARKSNSAQLQSSQTLHKLKQHYIAFMQKYIRRTKSDFKKNNKQHWKRKNVLKRSRRIFSSLDRLHNHNLVALRRVYQHSKTGVKRRLLDLSFLEKICIHISTSSFRPTIKLFVGTKTAVTAIWSSRTCVQAYWGQDIVGAFLACMSPDNSIILLVGAACLGVGVGTASISIIATGVTMTTWALLHDLYHFVESLHRESENIKPLSKLQEINHTPYVNFGELRLQLFGEYWRVLQYKSLPTVQRDGFRILREHFNKKTDAAVPGQLNSQTPVTEIMEKIVDLHHDLMFFIIVIVVFVSWMLGRLLYFHRVENTKNSRVAIGKCEAVLISRPTLFSFLLLINAARALWFSDLAFFFASVTSFPLMPAAVGNFSLSTLAVLRKQKSLQRPPGFNLNFRPQRSLDPAGFRPISNSSDQIGKNEMSTLKLRYMLAFANAHMLALGLTLLIVPAALNIYGLSFKYTPEGMLAVYSYLFAVGAVGVYIRLFTPRVPWKWARGAIYAFAVFLLAKEATLAFLLISELAAAVRNFNFIQDGSLSNTIISNVLFTVEMRFSPQAYYDAAAALLQQVLSERAFDSEHYARLLTHVDKAVREVIDVWRGGSPRVATVRLYELAEEILASELPRLPEKTPPNTSYLPLLKNISLGLGAAVCIGLWVMLFMYAE